MNHYQAWNEIKTMMINVRDFHFHYLDQDEENETSYIIVSTLEAMIEEMRLREEKIKNNPSSSIGSIYVSGVNGTYTTL